MPCTSEVLSNFYHMHPSSPLSKKLRSSSVISKNILLFELELQKLPDATTAVSLARLYERSGDQRKPEDNSKK